MNTDYREIRRKLKVLEHAAKSGNNIKTCRYFVIPKTTFYRWRAAYRKYGCQGLANKKPLCGLVEIYNQTVGLSLNQETVRDNPSSILTFTLYPRDWETASMFAQRDFV